MSCLSVVPSSLIYEWDHSSAQGSVRGQNRGWTSLCLPPWPNWRCPPSSWTSQVQSTTKRAQQFWIQRDEAGMRVLWEHFGRNCQWQPFSVWRFRERKWSDWGKLCSFPLVERWILLADSGLATRSRLGLGPERGQVWQQASCCACSAKPRNRFLFCRTQSVGPDPCPPASVLSPKPPTSNPDHQGLGPWFLVLSARSVVLSSEPPPP